MPDAYLRWRLSHHAIHILLSPNHSFRLEIERTYVLDRELMLKQSFLVPGGSADLFSGKGPKPEVVPLPCLAKDEIHASGRCVPCLYALKVEGCRKGDKCSHCHLCTKQEARARRRALHAARRTPVQGSEGSREDGGA